MKRFNLLYLLVPVVIFAILQINWNYAKHSVTFFGFAENKETEINRPYPVLINSVHVTPGQAVNQGDLLMVVTRASLGLKLGDLSYDVEALKVKRLEQKAELESSINKLLAQRQWKVADFEAKIQNLKAEMELNQSLVKNLKSINVPENSQTNSPNAIKIASLEKELEAVVKPIDVEIQRQKDELNAVNSPIDVQISKLKNRIEHHEKEEEKFTILAPTDGLIGNVHCIEGENMNSFRTLISFYERNPTLVEGYVHESLILHVDVGDTIDVSSSLHPEQNSLGIVVGLGTRIVEIPERLRKHPEIKHYGREVLIGIPPENPFLQKEKVVLNLRNVEDIPAQSFLPFLNSSKSKTQQANNVD